MSKTSKIVRIIIAGLMALIATFALVVLVLSIIDILNGGMIAVLLPFVILVYGIPFALATIIYQVVLIVKKKIWKVDLITSIYLVAVWLSSLLIILCVSIFG